MNSVGQMLKLLCSLHLLSSSLIRSLNPETYTSYCVYSEEEVTNNDRLDKYTKHVVACRNSNCSYYQRLIDSTGRIDAEATGAAMVGTVHCACWFAAEVLAPVTGGLSILAAGALAAGAFVGGDLLIENNIKKEVKKIEDELKEKWENEQGNIRMGEEVGENSQSIKQDWKK